jgi:signal transduction histidine kinase
MFMAPSKRQAALYWAALGSLAVLCCVLAVLQYRWIGEISRAEQDRLKGGLQSALQRISRAFDSEIEGACAALQPTNGEIDSKGREGAYIARYERWQSAARHDRLFSAIAIAIPKNGDVALKILDFETSRLFSAKWPEAWRGLHNQLLIRLRHAGPPPMPAPESNLIEVPRFKPSDLPGRPRVEQDWLIVELNVDYVRGVLLPALLASELHSGGALEYDTEVFTRGDMSRVIFQSRPKGAPRIGGDADASVILFSIRHGEIARRSMRGGRWAPRPAMASGPPEDGRWQLVIQSRAGSVAALVDRTRWRNLALSGLILMLLVATLGLLLRFSRKSQQLADLQMNFVAGVSHELRTPLTVIRTAAFNLRGKIADHRAQVERYGALIQDEAEKLTALVEQVLRFASTRAGRVVAERTSVDIENLIEESIRSREHLFDAAGLTIEKHLDPKLPPLLADEIALRHAVQNLIDNALKYGVDGNNWIGISASKAVDRGADVIEIRVADRGPGIPVEEQSHIFDAFFRGRRAIEEQVHGTGLGLNLVKKIVEAHGGSIRVTSDSVNGTEFVMRIPAAPQEFQNEFAHSLG